MFQRDEPRIHILHGKMKKLVEDLLTKFIDDKVISNMSEYGEMKLMDLMEFDAKSKEKFNAQREVGTKTRSLLKEFDSLEKKKFE